MYCMWYIKKKLYVLCVGRIVKQNIGIGLQDLVPNHQSWHAKRKLSQKMCTLRTCFCMFGGDLYAQSVLINKISASELRRNFIKSALLVGTTFL